MIRNLFVGLLALSSCAGIFIPDEPPSSPPNHLQHIPNAVKKSLPDLKFAPFVRESDYKSFPVELNVTDHGMLFVYSAINAFLELLQPNPFPSDLLKDEYLRNEKVFIESVEENYVQWIKYDQGFLIVYGVCLVLSLLFTVFYIFYLCCRCCCCGRKKEKPRADNRFDSCRRRSYTAIMSLIALVMVFAVACGFVSNQYLHISAQSIPKHARHLLEDIRTYRDENSQRIEKLLVTDYQQLNLTLLSAVDKASDAVVEGVKETSGAFALDRLTQLSKQAVSVLKNLTLMEVEVGRLEAGARDLQNSLGSLRSEVEVEFRDCAAESVCRSAKEIFDGTRNITSTLTDFSSVEEVKFELGRFSSKDIEGMLSGAIEEFNRLKGKFEGEISGRKRELQVQLEKYGRDLSSYASTVRIELSKAQIIEFEAVVTEHQNSFLEFELYRWIGGLVICAILGLMVGLFGLGLFYGCCGKRPSYYEDDCCVRRSGSKLFCGGITIGILFLVIIMQIAVALFLVGGNVQEIVCDPIKNNPVERARLTTTMEKIAKLNQGAVDRPYYNLSWIIESCIENQTFFTMFKLDEELEIRDILSGKTQDYINLQRELKNLGGDFAVDGKIPQILTLEAETTLANLQDISIRGIPPIVFKKLEEYIGNFDVFDRVVELEGELAESSEGEKREVQWKRMAQRLKTIEREKAGPLKSGLVHLLGNLTAINGSIPDVSRQIPEWLTLLRNAQGLLQSNLTGFVRSVGEQVGWHMADYVEDYRKHLNFELYNNIGSCEPLKKMVSSSSIKLCDQTLNPLNAYWASVGLCLLLAMPCIMLATGLRDLYRNTERYSGSDYSIYDEDHIPLNGFSLSHPSRGRSQPQHHTRHRVQDYISDTDHYSRAGTARKTNNTTTSPSQRTTNNIYANWRSPPTASTSNYFDNIAGPPPPYASPPRRGK